MQGRHGQAIEMVHPFAAEVDFREIADTLAQINRYCGASPKPVSVAQHTLIAFDAAPDEIKPWVLLHDCHEARIGDITTPAQQALGEVAFTHFGESGRAIIQQAIFHLKFRHDVAIHASAGLNLPNTAQYNAISQADLIALVTERRDFLSKPRFGWGPHIEALKPLRKVYRLRAAPDVADELFARFTQFLPALMPQARRA
jgi:hypothetical protein